MNDDSQRATSVAFSGGADLLEEGLGNGAARANKSSNRLGGPKTWVVLALVFGAGAALGSAITANVMNQRWREFTDHPERMPDRIANELREQLALDPDQAERVAAIVNERHRDFERIRAEIHPRASANFERMEQEIAEVLRDDQRPAFNAWIAEKRKRFPPPPQPTSSANEPSAEQGQP